MSDRPPDPNAECPECGEGAEWRECPACEGEGSLMPDISWCSYCHGDGGEYYCPLGCEVKQ
jgi:DnaJ-class molecular chaperone